MRVVVTRPQPEAQAWVDALRARGFEALAIPLIEIRPAGSTAPIVDAWRSLASLRAVMFVSGNAVRNFFALRPAGASWPAGTRAWCTGSGTRQALLDNGLAPGDIDSPGPAAPQFDSEALWAEVGRGIGPSDRVLIVRGGDASGRPEGRDWLAGTLAAAGAGVVQLVAYVRALPEWNESDRTLATQASQDAVWILSSSQAIEHLLRLVPAGSFAQARALATHPRIAQAARAAGFRVVRESRPTIDDVSAALEFFR